ncbi:WD40 repeat-like protein [Neoconidiobolus thromboides FSU 785]|nr:WD40 repeat-like protein [Neoconidiobolus thromboides FSU 785]
MGKKSIIEKELFQKRKKQAIHNESLKRVNEAPIIIFDNLINYCASLVTTVTGQKIKVFDVIKNKLEFDIISPTKSSIRNLKWCTIDGFGHKKEQLLVLCCDNGSILIYSLPDNEVILKLAEAHNGPITDFVVFKKFGFSSSTDGKIAKWNLGTGQLLNTWKAHSESINKLAAFEEHEFLISGGNSVNVWNIDTCKLVKSLPGHINKIQSISANSKQKSFITCAHQDRFISVHKMTKFAQKDSFITLPTGLTLDDEIYQVVLSSSSTVVSVTEKGNIGIWKTFYAHEDKSKGWKQMDKRYPNTTIQFTTPSKVQIPVLQVVCAENGKSFTVARGDTWNLSFETLKFPKIYKEKFTSYECVDPSALLKENKTLDALSKISNQVTIKSGFNSKGVNASVALTMGEKLSALETELKLNNSDNITNTFTTNLMNEKEVQNVKNIPNLEESVAKVMQQALHTNDINLLEATITSTVVRSIAPTVSNMGDLHIPQLFQYLVDLICKRKGTHIKHLEWIREILIQYSSYLVTIPWTADKLAQFIQASEARCQDIKELSKMNSKLDFIQATIVLQKKQSEQQKKRKVAPIYLENQQIPINHIDNSKSKNQKKKKNEEEEVFDISDEDLDLVV